MLLTEHQSRVARWVRGIDPLGEDHQWIMGWFGGQRSGKTTGAVYAMLIHGLMHVRIHPGLPIILAGRRIRSIETNILPPLRAAASTLGLPYHYQRGDQTVWTGPVQWWLYGANTEQSQAALQGITASGALIDELPKLPKSFWDEVVARCSIPTARIIATGNPEGPSHWCKTQLIDAGRCAYQLSNPMDNQHLDASVVERYREQYQGHMAARRISGQWAAATGLVYPTFQMANPQIRPHGPYEIGIDWGTASVTGALFIGKLGDHWIVWDEYYHDARQAGQSERTTEEHATKICDIANGYRSTYAVIDPSAAALRLSLRRRGLRVRRGNNDVATGIDVTNSILSNGTIQIHPRCINLVRELQTHRWDEQALLEHDTEKPLKQDDHLPDALRYWSMSRFNRI